MGTPEAPSPAAALRSSRGLMGWTGRLLLPLSVTLPTLLVLLLPRPLRRPGWCAICCHVGAAVREVTVGSVILTHSQHTSLQHITTLHSTGIVDCTYDKQTQMEKLPVTSLNLLQKQFPIIMLHSLYSVAKETKGQHRTAFEESIAPHIPTPCHPLRLWPIYRIFDVLGSQIGTRA